MNANLESCMAAGVFVEFQDADGHILAHAVFSDWHTQQLPALGDAMRCSAQGVTSGRLQTFAGLVIARHFEVQHDDDRPCLWVRLVVCATPQRPRRPTLRFSAN